MEFSIILKTKVFFGKVEGIKDLVTFETKKISEIQSAFIVAVEDYLELTKEIEVLKKGC